MSRTRLTRRTVLQAGAVSDRCPFRPFCPRRPCRRQAFLRRVGPLGSGRGRDAEKDLRRMGGKGKSRHYRRPDHLQRRQGPSDLDGGRASERGARHHGPANVVRVVAGREVCSGRRYRRAAAAKIRKNCQIRGVLRQDPGPLAGGADQLRQWRLAALCTYRHVQGVCRSRFAEDVSARTGRQGADRRLDLG